MRPGAERIPVMDALRGCAILCVVLFHVFVRTHFAFGVNLFHVHLDAGNTVQAGFLGVSIFFFVSGFCLMLPYASALAQGTPMPEWREYVSRRFWKIVPSYYLALGVALLIPLDSRAPAPLIYDALMHALFLHGFNAQAFTSLNSNFWSLAIEVEFYLVFPLIVAGFVRYPLITTALSFLCGLTYSMQIAHFNLDGTFTWSYQLPSFLPLFVFGILTAWIYASFIRGKTFSGELKNQCIIIAALGVFLIEYLFDQVNRSGGGPAAWSWENAHRFELGVALSLLSLAVMCTPQKVQRAVANPVLVFFSNASYNMYLWNAFVITFVASRFHGDDSWRGGIFMLASLGGTTLIGYVLTRYFERPLMRWAASKGSISESMVRKPATLEGQ